MNVRACLKPANSYSHNSRRVVLHPDVVNLQRGAAEITGLCVFHVLIARDGGFARSVPLIPRTAEVLSPEAICRLLCDALGPLDRLRLGRSGEGADCLPGSPSGSAALEQALKTATTLMVTVSRFMVSTLVMARESHDLCELLHRGRA